MPPDRGAAAGPGGARYTLVGPSGRTFRSTVPGALGGHRRGRLYGRLDCPSALRVIARGGYVRDRVFFRDEATAVAAGYRPCAVCLPREYRHWKAQQESRTGEPAVPSTRGKERHDMTGRQSRDLSRSPLVPAAQAARYAGMPAPSPHSEAELRSLLALLTAPAAAISTVAVGHSRDAASRAAAEAFTAAWQAGGGTVVAVVDWPEQAASWLRPAIRLTAQSPDAWVIAAAPLGWAQLSRRLALSTDWDPHRTFTFAPLAPDMVVDLDLYPEGRRAR
ncbi:Ada metal-binding domain-containing protein [Streptomyces sp. H39-S7]|uniref:Ada metal-binding domain-containing protein n=1 Tax=Streptomyces sp. H39-S7 TaxID=3004357 RepID=UPI0022AF4155|nr:Ada metal-binding domain-containing protein [Streptomyces sp. H39-S7]MCZ4123458.1 hypothetical protein [Streptomyces sp. H39-S7]